MLPVGTILLGLAAEGVGVGPAVAGSAGFGILLLAAWLVRWHESLRLYGLH